ncbi:hypothetical protein KVR01_011015 [Diaporthe batatas]|uniref:uncharacterized protein n=1 Tax=Diaporthe batatas TaxID=748121 RepID=UPI001D036E91|nr:uncharacterized protein KVR01_011015 [Diaporthe batatas]KAG8159354.1 hypothetical protein KVR01_011015 [Diaporthe batatas]
MESLKRTEYYYAKENVLQNVAVWEFPKDKDKAAQPAPGTTKWLIFIHGGAWRDPRSTFSEAEPTINALLDPASKWHMPDAPSRIAGFASLNYRLSPHPDFAQDTGTTPSFAARTARHPDHLDDVVSGLGFLQRQFGFGGDYVLFGHSAGAFLAYQALLGPALCSQPGPGGDFALPAAVVGFEGIYDLVGLDGRMGGGYASFIEAAFGRDRDGWRDASPATAAGSFGEWAGQEGPRLAVLAHSADDELVDMPELGTMEERLRSDGVRDLLVFRDLKGGHMNVVSDGSFARVLVRTLDELARLKGQ